MRTSDQPAEKNITDTMSIELPKTSNPIHFSNVVSIDEELSKLLRHHMDGQALEKGLPPEAAAKMREAQAGTYPESAGRADFFQETWQVVDPPGRDSDWQITPDWELVQLNRTGSYKSGSKEYDLGTLAVSKKEIDTADVIRVSAHITMGAKDETGLVFNFKSAHDYWVFLYKYNDKWKTTPSVLYIRRVLSNKIVFDTSLEVPEVLAKRSLEFLIQKEPNADNLQCTLKSGGHTYPVPRSSVKDVPWHADGRFGFYTRYAHDATFRELKLETQAGDTTTLFPSEAEYDEVSKEYSDAFGIETIDLRPANWVARLKQLWAQKFLASNRMRAAKAKYDALFSDTSNQLLTISPRDIDNAETLYNRAFHRYIIVKERFDELINRMKREGIHFTLSQVDTDEVDLAGDFDYTLEQTIRTERVSVWKEFYIEYTVFDAREKEIDRHYNRVRHATFLTTPTGLYTENRGIDVYVTAKDWETRYSKQVEERVVEMKHSGNLFDELDKLIGSNPFRLDTTREQNVRHYEFVNGRYVDQYGISLEEHVLSLTEHPDNQVEDVLVIPVTHQSGNGQAEKLLIVRDPVFSGRRIHPTSVHFEEKYMMDVKWDGIGLGEFSHSVNLFPGEQREIQLVTSRKRSFETVASSTSSSSTSASQESDLATKRADSFSSKLQESMENSHAFSTSSKSTTTKSVSASVKAGWGWGSAKVSAGISNTSSSSSGSSTSAVAKRASDMASQSSAEVSQNNKVSFASTTNMEQSLEEKVTGEDMESETTTIRISNVNEGRTVNYNFFQVTNTYKTELQVEDALIHVSTGIEIIPGTGITIDKTFEVEDFARVGAAFPFLSEEQRKALQQCVSAEVLKKYLVLPDEALEDAPQILHFQTEPSKTAQEEWRRLRGRCELVQFNLKQALEPEAELLPEELLGLGQHKFIVRPAKLRESHHYTVNSGKYYVESHVGLKPATEAYLEERRVIETEKQRALVEEIQKRTELGVFFQDLPEGLQSLNTAQDEKDE